METLERAPRPEKVAIVADVGERLASASATLLTEYRGLSVASLEQLRRALRDAGGEYKVYKNSLVRLAVAAAGVDVADDLLIGPTGIAFVTGDVSAVAKVLRDFAREHPDLVLKGGFMGREVLTAADTAALAELPSRDALLGQIAGVLAAPMQRFAGLLQALPSKFAYALAALIDAAPAAAPDAASPAAPPEAAAPAASDAEDAGATPAEDDPAAAGAPADAAAEPAASGDGEADAEPDDDAAGGEA